MEYKYNFNNKNENKFKIIFFVIMIIIILVISSFFLRNNNNNIVSRIFSIINKPFSFIDNVSFNIFKDKESVIKENSELKEKVKDLEYKLLEIKRLEKENDSLKNLLDIKENFKQFKLKNAKIINRSFDDFSQTIILNVGLKDGVKIEDTVISENGLVGYVSNVSEDKCVVTTILSPKTNISVVIATLNQNAIAKGDLSLKLQNKLKLEYIPLNSEISIGDSIYTSGIGSIFKSSILVGKVINVVNNKNDTDRYAIIEPSVNVNNLTEVAVIVE